MLEKSIKLIPHTLEKYLAFVMDDIKFPKSLAFLPASLDCLSQSLTKDEKENFLRQCWPEEDLSNFLQKTVLPYEYFTSMDVFAEENLPPISAYHLTLTDSDIDDVTYERLKEIWTQFNCKTLGDLHDIYVKLDIFLLASVFENFRETSFNHFNIYPCHYFSCPRLTRAAALKQTKVELDLFTDVDML